MSEEYRTLNQHQGESPIALDSPPDRSFEMRIGGTTYVVGMHYSRTSHETLENKVKQLIEQDLQEGVLETKKEI